MPVYNAGEIEEKWQKRWEKIELYKTDLKDKKHPKYYNLVMFPYPSGDKLHIGHWYNFAPADSWGRYMRMNGHNVFEPIGFDSFGLPAENYAIKTGAPPHSTTEKNIEYMRHQLRAMGTMYDWSKEVVTSHPDYYRWTQWIFLQMYKKGLAYKKEAPVNWCPQCQTVLANEQVQDGTCERCDTKVTQKNLTQWFFKITSYAEDLLRHENLEWPEKTILMQKNWIGRKEGINIEYDIEGLKKKIAVFTTRPDTNFGATFIVIAPDSEFTSKNLHLFPNKTDVISYIELTSQKTELERVADGRKKTGMFTGLYAINNLNGRKMPVYVGDFVLATVGTGNVVGVPGHDLRDFEFAKAMKLEIIRVVVGPDGDTSQIERPEQVQEKSGTMINSDFLDGLDIHAATKKIMDFLEEKKWGKRVIVYRLRDWLISRQRYWGAPIPIVHCKKCGDIPVKEEDLPVLLPEKNIDYLPKGKSPLAGVPDFVQTKCPKCNGQAEREVDTMDTFVDSSWYFLRYLDPKNTKNPFSATINKKWMPVDMYIGGPEHACMHLLYARFIHKVLMNDTYAEPFRKLVHQGLITKNGAKMSKSKGNVVSPDAFVEKYGSDIFRMYLMFMGPFTEGGDWHDQGISGIARFVERFYLMVKSEYTVKDAVVLQKLLHRTIKKVTEDIEKFHFNTAIAALMEFVNTVQKTGIDQKNLCIVVKLIAPLAPHLAEQMWEELGQKFSIFDATWPVYDPKEIQENVMILPIQINGKLRGQIEVPRETLKEAILSAAKIEKNVARHLEGKKVIKEIYVPGKLVSLVIN